MLLTCTFIIFVAVSDNALLTGITKQKNCQQKQDR